VPGLEPSQFSTGTREKLHGDSCRELPEGELDDIPAHRTTWMVKVSVGLIWPAVSWVNRLFIGIPAPNTAGISAPSGVRPPGGALLLCGYC
jgi:hypothetical protein